MEDKRVKMQAKFQGTCAGCLNRIKERSTILWCPDTKYAWHEGCKNKPAKKKQLAKMKKKTAQNNKAQRGLNTARPARGSARFFRFDS